MTANTVPRPITADVPHPLRALAQRLWGCRLCKSVTFSVFVLILAIESIILIPSAHKFRNDALLMLEQQTMLAMQPVVLAEDTLAKPRELEQLLSKIQRDSSILAASIRNAKGVTLAQVGDANFSDFAIDDVVAGRRDKVGRFALGGSCYDLAWNATAGGERLVFLTRLDSSQINTLLTAFILRIAGLVVLIVAVVTAGTMLVLYRSVLSPFLKLRRSMIAAAAHPDRAGDYQIRERPRNEFGDVFLAHDEMLARIAESKRADQLRAEERARFLARHDALTGLPNRDFFLEHLRQTLSAACERGEQVQVQVLNLAGFSAINGALGQNVGDRVLIEVARKLNQGVSAGQFVARLGGDEFGIASAGAVSPTQAAEHAERILAEIEHPLVIDGNEVRPRGRIGIASSSTGCTDAETVLHDAEVVLTRIRSDARARYQFFSPEMTQEAQRRQETEGGLRQALERGEFQLFYQAQIRRWREAGLTPPRVAVNVAALQFRDPKLPEMVRGAIAAAGIESETLELEITESAAMSDATLTVAVLASLRAVGVRLSIDDFGTGYSSLSYLRKFDIDAIKIDKSFVDDIGDANADAICDAIISLGHSLGKKIVAEGVETRAQLEFLSSRRCEEAQGFLFARPMPADDIAARLPRAAA